MTLKLCSADEIPEIWGEVRAVLLTAINMPTSRWRERDVLLGLLTEDMQLWRHGNTAAVTRIVIYPRCKTLNFMFLAGDSLKDWLPFESTVAMWARDRGCSLLSMGGREGWSRVVEGWEKTDVTMQKRI